MRYELMPSTLCVREPCQLLGAHAERLYAQVECTYTFNVGDNLIQCTDTDST